MRAVLLWVCGLVVVPLAHAAEVAINARPPIVTPASGTVSPSVINACGPEAFGQPRRSPVTGRMQICRPVAQ